MIDKNIVCSYLYIITKYGYPPAAEDTGRYLEEMKALGFQSVELEGIRRDHLLEVYNRRDEIAAKLKALNLNVTYFCVVLPGLASANPQEREQTLQLFRQGCQIAAQFGAKGVLDNAPLPPYIFPGDIPIVRHFDADVLQAAHLPPGLNWPNYWEDLVDTYRAACDIAAQFNLTYQLHPCLGVLAATPEGFLYFRDAVGRDNLRFNLDTSNLFVLKENLVLALRRLAGSIDYIHLSDNRGRDVEHLTPGQGTINWESFFETLALIEFEGQIGIDVGGAESNVGELDRAYKESAQWIARHWNRAR